MTQNSTPMDTTTAAHPARRYTDWPGGEDAPDRASADTTAGSGMTGVAVRRAAPADRQTVADLLAAAFLHADLADWLIPDLSDRERIYPGYFDLLTEHALQHGHVEITDDGRAAALWYLHDGRDIPDLPGYDTRLATITRPYTARFVALDVAMHSHHPHDEDHHYLALLAVHPSEHSHGYGSHLLHHHHAQLDHDGIPAYLEATGRRTSDLYATHGYERRRSFPIARNGPSLTPMWRNPRPASGLA